MLIQSNLSDFIDGSGADFGLQRKTKTKLRELSVLFVRFEDFDILINKVF